MARSDKGQKRDLEGARRRVDQALAAIYAGTSRLAGHAPFRDSEDLLIRAALRDLASVGGYDLNQDNF